MITDNYLDGAIDAVKKAREAIAQEITRLQESQTDTGNLESIEHLIQKADSFLVRMKETFR